jgi:thioredoxin reductase (NADPH)
MKQVEKKYDVLIIGGGPAGIFAAYLAHVKGLRPLLIETSDNLGGQPLNLYGQKKVYDYPGFTNITATQLVDIFTKQLTNEKQIPVLLNTSLISVNRTKNEYVVSLNNNRTVQAKYIIIATGAGLFTPNILQIPGVTSKNTCYSISQMNVYSNKQIVILGGGDSAVD